MRRSTAASVLSVCGARIGFEISDASRTRVRSAFAYTTVAGTDEEATIWYRGVSSNGNDFRFERDDPLRSSEPTPVGSSIEELIDDLHLSIALHASDDVFVHAGVVAWNGAAIVIPGRSQAGKSTLVHALVRAGATYYSDEYARVVDGGMIAPYARPIQLRSENGRRTVDANTIGAVGVHPVAPGLVVFTRFAHESTFAPERVSPSAAALELFDNTVIAEVQPERATTAVAQIARTAIAVRSERPEAAATARKILELTDILETNQ